MTRAILHDLGFFGHFLHVHAGGRGGKQFVLTALHKHDGRLTQRELLEQSCISPAALSEVVAKLEAEGLIAREPYEHDRRQQLIELTQAGEVRAADICRQRERFEEEALSCLSDDEQEQLQLLLGKIRRHWTAMEEDEVIA